MKKILFYVIIFIYIIGGILAIILSDIYKFNREHIGAAFFLGPFLYLSIAIAKNHSQIDLNNKKRLPYLFKISLIIWIILMILSVFIFMMSREDYYLSLTYFLSISSMALIIAIQILTIELSKLRTYIILIEIISLSAILSTSFLYLFSGPYGNDSLFHIGYILNILDSGNIDHIQAGKYQLYPIYQMTFSEIIILTNIDNKTAQLLLSLIQIFSLLFVFLICRQLFNIKSGLMSTLIISLSTYSLVPRYTYYPGGYSVIFFIILLYLLYSDSGIYITTFSIIILIVANFTHPMTSFIITFTVLMMLITNNIVKSSFRIKTSFIAISIILLSIQWMRPAGDDSLLSKLVDSIRFTFEERAVTQATSSSFYNWTDVMMYELGFTLLILFGISGVLYFLRSDMTKIQDKRISLSLISSIFIPLPYFLTIVYPNSLPARWFQFVEILSGIFAGAILTLYYDTFSRYKLRYLIFIVIFILIFFSITSPIVNPDSQIYSKNLSGRSALIDSEEKGIIFAKINLNDSIRGNSKYIYYFYGTFSTLDDPTLDNMLDPRDMKTYKESNILIRKYDMEKGFTIPLFGSKKRLVEIIPPTKEFLNFLYVSNMIYNSSTVNIYDVR